MIGFDGPQSATALRLGANAISGGDGGRGAFMTPDGQLWAGVVPATLRACRADEALDEAGLRGSFAELAADEGVRGLVCNGRTGEAMSSRPRERARVAEFPAETVRASNGRPSHPVPSRTTAARAPPFGEGVSPPRTATRLSGSAWPSLRISSIRSEGRSAPKGLLTAAWTADRAADLLLDGVGLTEYMGLHGVGFRSERRASGFTVWGLGPPAHAGAAAPCSENRHRDSLHR